MSPETLLTDGWSWSRAQRPRGFGRLAALLASLAWLLLASCSDKDAASEGDRRGADASSGGATDAASCTGWTSLQRLSPTDAHDLLATLDPFVINVHVPYEGDIPGTDTEIPYSDVDAIENYAGHDHCAEVLLICKSGGMSQSAGNELVKRGYLRVRDLLGGMQAWEAAGYSLTHSGG